MQILAAGGVPPATDRRREADANNPKGYLEHEAMKGLKTNPSAIEGCEGRAVKVVAMLLPHLPADRTYRVLFVHRHLDEVVASQRKMIERLGKPAAPIRDEQLKAVLGRQVDEALRWCERTPGVSLLEVQHRALCLEPAEPIAAICGFLGLDLDESAMLAVSDPTLYRERQ